MEHPSYRDISLAIRRRTDWTDGLPIGFADEGAEVYFLPFQSRQAHHLLGRAAYRCKDHGLEFPGEPTEDGPADCDLQENLRFRYPLLRAIPSARAPAPARHLVVLLHGLNERSFTKYVPWAYQLWRTTGAAVALFPLSFHIGRVNPGWGRDLEGYLRRRRQVDRNENVHAFNCVISDRLDAHPERFFWGGLQSHGDVADLVRQVRAGEVAQVDPQARIDLVGYSAGGYLALALLLADEDGLFRDSRCVIFESGAALRSTSMSSRFIIDHACEVSLMKLYVRFTGRLANARLAHWLSHHELGRWFRAMCGEEAERPRLEARLRQLAPRLLGISNLRDEVIPAAAILNTLKGLHRDTGVRIQELSLGVHEHPFACPDYAQRDRAFVTGFVDPARFGGGFETFIDSASALLRGPG
jgi:pimeloyl-ACP methyl ester carboxylesterase